MQRFLLLLLLATCAASLGSAQTNSIQASWTNDQKVVLEALPATGQTVTLPITAEMTQRIPNLKATCEKMSNKYLTWRINDDTSTFIITLQRDQYPLWTQKDWEMYINRVSGVYLAND